MNPIQSLYYVSPACGIFLLVPFLTVELPEIMANVDLVIDWKVLFLNATCAFLLNLAVFLLIGKTSALTKFAWFVPLRKSTGEAQQQQQPAATATATRVAVQHVPPRENLSAPSLTSASTSTYSNDMTKYREARRHT